jgi:glycosyltransferase involved in cell wall biosynthesis
MRKKDKIEVAFLGGLHPVHREMISFGPPGIEFKVYDPEANDFLFWLSHRAGINVVAAIESDLIHSHNRLVLNRRNWILEIDHISSPRRWIGSGVTNLLVNSFREKVLDKKDKIKLPGILDMIKPYLVVRNLQSPYCKKIIAWSNWAITDRDPPLYTSVEKKITETREITEKFSVIYPAIKPRKSKIDRNNDGRNVKLLFVGNGFFRKGGDILIGAFQQLKREYNLFLTVVSNFLGEIHYQQAEGSVARMKNALIRDEKIKWLTNVDRETLLAEIYPQHDIFVMPTNGDLFLFSILEAMHNKLPVISTRLGAIPEMVEDGVNGFLLESPVHNYGPPWDSGQRERIMNALVGKISLLAENSHLRKEMGEASYQIAGERFSYELRNEKLKKVYLEANE